MKEQNALQKKEPTISERFTAMVVREFSSGAGMVEFGPLQRRLAQHLYIKIDMVLKDAEAKRLDKLAGRADTGVSISWTNVNMQRLAMDSVHRIQLGLDALIPNHLHPIPYFNGRTKKYDLDLRIGYAGKDYYHRGMALVQPIDIIYELVYETDTFKPIKKTAKNPIESYEFEIVNPFNRGDVVGGFAYIMYEDERKNKLILVTGADFEKSRKKAGSDMFWGPHPDSMKWKTIVHRTMKYIPLDPEKINESFAVVESQDSAVVERVEERAAETIREKANQGPVVDIPNESPPVDAEFTDPEESKAANVEPPVTEGPDF